jgi:hypothetical protein
MEWKFLVFLFMVVLLASIGCQRKNGFVVSVEPLPEASRKGPVCGIPFYKKIPVFVQSTVYLDPFYEVRLYIDEGTVSKELKPALLPVAVSLIAEKDLPTCSKFIAAIRGVSTIEGIIEEFNQTVVPIFKIRSFDEFDRLAKEQQKKKAPNSSDQDQPELGKIDMPQLFSNASETKMVIDWNHIYYINYKVPVVGSSSLNAEFNSDGTLTKAVGETEEKTFEAVVGAISTLLPVKEYLTKKWVPGENKRISGKEMAIALEIEKKVCKYTLTKVHQEWAMGYPAICPADNSASRILEIVDATTAKKDEKKEATKNAIEFSGQVKLPAEEKKENK